MQAGTVAQVLERAWAAVVLVIGLGGRRRAAGARRLKVPARVQDTPLDSCHRQMPPITQ